MATIEIDRPRYIDTVARPQNVGKVKVFVLSPSRCGTLGLYKGLNILGYKAYHMVEVVAGGLVPIRMFREYIRLNNGQGRGAKPYGRLEFDKWFAGFDAVCEVPSYSGGMSVVDAYIGDPDVKFILTERTPASFSKSINKAVGGFVLAGHSFPLKFLKYFDTLNLEFFGLGEDLYRVYAQGRMPTDPDCVEMIERWYEEYITTIKKSVPPERLLAVRLEDGLGWEQICPFLGLDIPKTPYPRGNDPDEFKKIAMGFLEPGIKKAFVQLGVSVVAVASACAWWMFPRIRLI